MKLFDKRLILPALVLIVMIFSMVGVIILKQMVAPVTPGSTVDGWRTYSDKEFNFSVSYPSDWKINLAKQYDFPIITIYKSSSSAPALSFYKTDLPQVTFLPKGFPSDAYRFGNGTTSRVVKFKNAVVEDNMLADGTVYMTNIRFTQPPAGWEEFGFIYAFVDVIGSNTQCDSNPNDDFGACIISGSINQQDRKIEEKILQSIQFTK